MKVRLYEPKLILNWRKSSIGTVSLGTCLYEDQFPYHHRAHADGHCKIELYFIGIKYIQILWSIRLILRGIGDVVANLI